MFITPAELAQLAELSKIDFEQKKTVIALEKDNKKRILIAIKKRKLLIHGIGNFSDLESFTKFLHEHFSVQIQLPKSLIINKTYDDFTDSELVDLYRISPESEKNKIFRVFLYKRKYKNLTWDQFINSVIYSKYYRLNQFRDLQPSDLYQEATLAFEKTISKWYNKTKRSSFSTYAIKAINNYITRRFLFAIKEKRKSNNSMNSVGIYDKYRGGSSENNNLLFEHVISNFSGSAAFKTIEKETDFETISIYRNVLRHLQKSLQLEPIIAPIRVLNEMSNLIKMKTLTNSDIFRISERTKITIQRLNEIKKTIQENLEKSLYKDIISYYQLGQRRKDYLLAKKHNCSRAQITKTKFKLSEFCKKNLKKLDLTVPEIFNTL
jgi:hypothetical protein